MSAIILGDVHIGKSLINGRPGIGSALNSRIVDQLNLLEWTLSKAIELMAECIIITGDVFEDNKPHPTLITLFISWLKKCTDHNINIHIVVGNHDILRSGQFYMSALDIIVAADIDGVYIHNRISTLHMKDASFTFMPYRDRRSFNTDSNAVALQLLVDNLPYELSEIDRSNAKIVIGHFAIEESISIGDEIDDMTNELFCPVSMFKGYDYVWMGHIHKPQEISQSPLVAHIGSMDISNFGESDHKKVIVFFDANASSPYKYLELPTRPLNQISISVPDNITDTTIYVENEIKEKHNNLNRAIVRLNILYNNVDSVNINRSIIENCLTNAGAFHITRINEEKRVSLIKKDDALKSMDNTINEKTAIKMYADNFVDEKIKDEFIMLANEIIKEAV